LFPEPLADYTHTPTCSDVDMLELRIGDEDFVLTVF
jgi:hypothetical protein